ncbi:MAG: NAD/NADP octopine/nopaline dehydrogenase family protein [Lachnospiraceae bacterium]|nr:NAD/NADP octopine/nopaline dehydrogenase family protein [Lachnospiraceae bacterium]
MKFTIIGGGNAGKAAAVYLKSLGQDAVLCCRDEKKAEQLNACGIDATGAVEGHFDIPAFTDPGEAVSEAEVILVQTTASGHAPVAKALRSHLRSGQIILIFNGLWGAAEFDSILREGMSAEAADSIRICETNAQLFLCSSPSAAAVHIKSVKKGVALACTDKPKTGEVLQALSPVFPQFTAGSSVIDTSLNGSNPVIHGPISLFNITRFENGEDYTLFGTALPAGTVKYIEQIDAERCAVIRALGVAPVSVLDIINGFWPDKKSTLYSALKENPSYKVSKGPKTLEHRYLNEDIPYGLVPIVRLGRKLGVETPYLDALVRILGYYLDRDYLTEGPDVEQMDLGRLA